MSQNVVNPYMVTSDACTYRSGTEFTDWTLSGAYAIVSDALVADMPVGDTYNGDHGYYDIGTANISATAWILRWKWNITGATHSGGGVALVQCGLFSDNESAGTSGSYDGSYSSTQKVASIFTSITAAGKEYFQACTGSASNNAYSVVTRSDLSDDFAYPASYFFQVKRFDDSGTDTLQYGFTTNSDFSSLTTVDVTNATYMPSDLRYLKVESLQPFSDTSNGLTTTIENMTFNNDTDVACS